MLACGRQPDEIHARVSAVFAAKKCCLKAISTICNIVNACFPPVTERRVEAKKFKFTRFWPSNPADILPRGSEGYRGLLYWLSLLDDVPVIKIIMRVFLWCRPAFFAEFSREASRALFWETICLRFDSCLAEMSARRQSGGRSTLDDSDRACARLGCLTVILIDIADFGRGEWPEWPRLFRGVESKLLDYTTTAMSYLTDGTPLMLQLRDFCLDLHACLGLESLGRMAPDLVGHFIEEQVSYHGAFGHFKYLLHSLASRRLCAAPECLQPILIPDPLVGEKRSFRCGSCRIVQYCGRDCQRRHWRAKAQPHKAICAVLRPLASYTSLDTELSTFANVCHGQQLDVHELAVIYAYLIGHRVAPGFNQEHFETVADDMWRMLRSIDLLHDLSVARSSNPAVVESIAAQLNAIYCGREMRQPARAVAALSSSN
ncbi:hypothetical protein AURDEDRAFT_159334 [Auricularia subglabra TFB-10046 SS5]|nr:hypothetical protein AURDEDRAFT_159334 [Auricularia subglabra TFB-10046 SS5]